MLNKVLLLGRLTADPELKHTNSNIAVTTFSIAVDRNFTNQEKKTDFLNVVCWRQTAEFVCKHFNKGDFIAVDGSLQQRSFNKNVKDISVIEVVADNVSFAGGK